MPRGRPPREQVHLRLRSAVDELRVRLGGLPSPIEAGAIWTDIWHHEAHNSTAIEGNTLVLREVEILLEQGKAIGAKQLRDYMEVQGYAQAAQWVYGQAMEPADWSANRLVTLQEVRQVHYTALTPVWQIAPHEDATDDESPGNFRRHNIHRFPGGMQPPDFTDVPALMTEWVEQVCRIRDSEEAISVSIARCHAAFERIHPFLDGNGRSGRLLMNLVLVRMGYPPAIIYKRERSRYLSALDRADEGDPAPLAEMIARSILDNLYRFVVPAIAGPVRLVPLAALATPAISLPALRTAAVRGRLEAQRGTDGQWRSTRKWVDDYLAGRSARGRPRQPSSG
jgi:hypothetical protein